MDTIAWGYREAEKARYEYTWSSTVNVLA